MPLTSFKLGIAREFFRDANYPGTCFTPRLIWPSIDIRRTKQLLGFGFVATLAGDYVVGKHVERMRLSFNNFCHSCRFAEAEKTVNHFICQSLRGTDSPTLVSLLELSSIDVKNFRSPLYGLVDSPILVSLTELSSINVKDITSFIKFLGWSVQTLFT